MLTSLLIENFKAFKSSQQLRLAPITLIYGRNSSGKSSLIQSLLLLKQSIDASQATTSSFIARGPMADLGNFKALIHGHDQRLHLRLGIGVHPNRGIGANSMLEGESHVVFDFAYLKGRKSVVEESLLVASAKGVLRFTRLHMAPSSRSSYRRNTRQLYNDEFALLDEDSKAIAKRLIDEEIARQRLPHRTEQINLENFNPTFSVNGLLPGQLSILDIRKSIDEIARDPIDVFYRRLWSYVARRTIPDVRVELRNLSYLGPIRRALPRLQSSSGTTQRNVGREGEYTAEIMAREPALTKEVNAWLRILQVPYTVRARIIGDPAFGDIVRFTLTDDRSKTQMSASDVGFGISQMLPIVVQCVFARDSLICIEQPEIHLHPALQAELGDLFLQSLHNSANNQFIIETHSEHLLLRIQRRIRNGNIKPSDVVVYYVDQDSLATSRAIEMRLGEDGEMLDSWPSGFFEEKLKEILSDA